MKNVFVYFIGLVIIIFVILKILFYINQIFKIKIGDEVAYKPYMGNRTRYGKVIHKTLTGVYVSSGITQKLSYFAVWENNS